MDTWRQWKRARRQALRQRRREQQRLLWGGPVEADSPTGQREVQDSG